MTARVRIVGVAVWLGVIAGCPSETLDPNPPFAASGGGGEADNPLLDDGPVSCEDRKTAAEEHVLAAVADAVEGCTTDADCTLLDPAAACYGSCPLAVSAHGEARVRRAASDADERWCRGFAVQCGELVEPPPDCSVAPARCEEGRCVSRARGE